MNESVNQNRAKVVGDMRDNDMMMMMMMMEKTGFQKWQLMK